MTKRKLFAVISCILTLLFLFAACGPLDTSSVPDKEDPPATTPEDQNPQPEPFSVQYRSDFAPTKFGKEVKSEVTELGAGVHLVKNTAVKTNGDTSVVWAVEVDLNKANIIAGTQGNKTVGADFSHAAPYQMALDWEAFTNGHVYTSLNADFFDPGSSTGVCVNAFVKDGYIIKAGHNDNRNYDYKQTSSDVPASAPMLFGVKGKKAQIAPIVKVDGDPTDPAVKQQFVKSTLSYEVSGHPVSLDSAVADDHLALFTAGSNVKMTSGCAVKVSTAKGMSAVEVLEVIPITAESTLEQGYKYLAASGSGACTTYLSSLREGENLSFNVASPDGTWNGYQTILGCRQALVTGGAIAPTVTKENSNGAQSPDVPRSAVGLKDDHTVVIFAVESMYYGTNQPGRKDKPAAKNDPHGMNLPELAEFIYFYGCNEAANFDGGGSTQLVARGEKETEGHVIIRSSDTAGTGLMSTRSVVNSILVVKR